MKFYRRIWIQEKAFPADLYEAIVKLKPESKEGDHFRVECQPDDHAAATLAEQIVTMCNDAGIKHTSTGEIGTYGYDVARRYGPADLAAAPFLMMETQRKIFRKATQRDENGRLCLPASEAASTVKIGSIYPTWWIIVSDEVRTLLEEGRMQGVQFREVVIRGRSAHASVKPFWELTSKVRLPKMINSRLNGDTGCSFIEEPPYRDAEPHYRQSELQPISVFDVTLTSELFGATSAFVISQKLYQLCLQQKIPLEVRPVRIDPD